jgi:hypothetical protein
MLFTAKTGEVTPPFGFGSTWLTKDAAGLFKFFLVIVGTVQAWMFLTKLRYMRRSMRDTADASKAADDAAAALSRTIIPKLDALTLLISACLPEN